MTKHKAYLSGPIDNCSSAEIKDWRNWMKDNYPQYEWLDPLDLTENMKPRVTDKDFFKIIPKEKEMIIASSFMFVYPWKPSSGTAMEVMFAYERNIPVFAVKGDDYISPWVAYHCTHVADTFVDAMKFAEAYLENKSADIEKVA